MEHAAILKRMSLFQGLDSLELVQVSKRVRHRRYRWGDRVLTDGEPGASLFMVKSGEFRATMGEGLSAVELAKFGEGDSFGEVALIDHGPRSASVEALSNGELIELDARAFQELLAYSPDLKCKLLENLARDLAAKLRHTNDTLALLL